MSRKYYQEYGPMRRRRSESPPPPDASPIEPVTELDLRLPINPRRGARRRGRSPIGLLLMTMLGIALILAAPYGLAYALPLINGTRAPEGITIQGQAVGGLEQAQIRSMLEQRYQPFLQQPLTLTYEGRTWQPTLAELGVELDLDRTAATALAAGSQGGPLQRIEALWSLWQGGLEIAPSLHVNGTKLQTYLASLALTLEQPPRDAALSISAGKVLPTGSEAGRQMLVDDTALDVLQALRTLTPQQVALRTRILAPTLDDTAIMPAVEEARTLLKSPLKLTQGSRDWTWDEERIASLLSIKSTNGQMMVELDRERLGRALEKLAQVVDSGSVEPRVAFRDGAPQIVQEGQQGLRLMQAEAVDAVIEVLHSDKHILELPVEALSPQVTTETLPTLGLIELVGEGRSSFAGSAAYRITNIKAGAAQMNGVLIPPGAEFSFNTQLGAVDESNGFVQGYAVIGNRTQLEWGGGVCQVSTTVFRAAFWAGVPITERHAHPFYISWYDAFSFPGESAPGLDATIFTGVQDFRFVNDTKQWMVMEAIVDEGEQVLTIRLYGTRPDRVVSIVGPEINNIVPPPAQAVYTTDPNLPVGTVKQTDTARKGMDINVYRVIEQGGVKQPPELFFTRFKAWPDVFVRGTGSP